MRLKVPAFLLCCLGPLWGTTYYVSNSGSDSNNGTSAGTPWQTIAHVNAQTFSPGDSVLFQAGGLWREELDFPSSGTAGNVITIGSYGSGAQPIITGANVITGWTVYSGNVWQATVTTAVNVVIFDGILGEDMATSLAGVTGALQWYSTSTILYVYSMTNPGSTIQGGVRVSAINTEGNSYLTITGLDLQGANGTNQYGPTDVSVAGADLYISYGGAYITSSGNTFELTAVYGAKVYGSNQVLFTGDTIRNIAGDYGYTRGDGIDVVGYEIFNGMEWIRTGPSTNITVTGETLTGYFDRQGIAFEDVNGGTISNNSIAYQGPWAPIDIEPQPGWVDENLMIGPSNSIVLSAPPSYAVNAYPSVGIAVNNTSSGSTTGPNILVILNTINVSSIAFTDGIQLQCSAGTITQCTAQSNTIENLAGSSLGIIMSGTIGQAISNTITSTGGHIGFYLEGSTPDPVNSFDIEGNLVSGTFDNGLVVSGAAITATIGQFQTNSFTGNMVSNSKGAYVNLTSPPSLLSIGCNGISYSGWAVANLSINSGNVIQMGCGTTTSIGGAP
jgi:hypothetical protein